MLTPSDPSLPMESMATQHFFTSVELPPSDDRKPMDDCRCPE